MDKNKKESQSNHNSTLDWLPVSSAVCRFGWDWYPDSFMDLNFANIFFRVFYDAIGNVFLNHTDDRLKKTL